MRAAARISDKDTWPVGQAVKTPAFHAGNRGSSPLRVTNNIQRRTLAIIVIVRVFLFRWGQFLDFLSGHPLNSNTTRLLTNKILPAILRYISNVV